MQHSIDVFIPSRGRAGNTPALNRLARVGGLLYVPSAELAQYRAADPQNVQRLRVYPDNLDHIGKVRHWLMHEATADYVWMVDDDVINDDLVEGIERLTAYAIYVRAPMIGFGYRFMAQARLARDGQYSYYGYTSGVRAIRRDAYLESGANMADWPVHEDTYVLIKMSMIGQVPRSNQYLVKTATNRGGGCDTYRTPEMIVEYAHKLADRFKGIVSVIPSKMKNQGYELGVSTRVSWSKIAPQARQ